MLVHPWLTLVLQKGASKCSSHSILTSIFNVCNLQEGMVQYVQFVPLAATMISHLYGADSMKLRLQVRNIFLV
jgi:hypothetical protein